jgi:putative RNA 2'-phosphotransferase
MDRRQRTRISKFLSYVLRHNPGEIGLEPDPAGWVDVDALLAALEAEGRPLTRSELDEVVTTNDKQRFAFSPDGRRIRAAQGHSIAVDHDYEPADPPATLYHGTVEAVLPAIRKQGLRKMLRHHVHLSADEETARAVGARRGRPVILRIDAAAMVAAGHVFFRSSNGVWLTDSVPPGFICEPG